MNQQPQVPNMEVVAEVSAYLGKSHGGNNGPPYVQSMVNKQNTVYLISEIILYGDTCFFFAMIDGNLRVSFQP